MIRNLEKEKADLATKLHEVETKVAAQTLVMKQDKEYSDRIHHQLQTAAELLKASEKNFSERELELTTKIHALQQQLERDELSKQSLQQQLEFELEKRKSRNSSSSRLSGDLTKLKSSDVDSDHQNLMKEVRKQKKKLDEQQTTIETLRTQLHAFQDESNRRQYEYEVERHAYVEKIQQLQKDAVSLSNIADGAKDHSQALEAQLEWIGKQKLKWKGDADVRIASLANELLLLQESTKLQIQSKDKIIHSLEKKVHECKRRWRADREKYKPKTSESQRRERSDGLHDNLQQRAQQEQTAPLMDAQKRNAELEREIATLQEMLERTTSRESVVNTARQRVLAERVTLESALRDHVQKASPRHNPDPTISTWVYTS